MDYYQLTLGASQKMDNDLLKSKKRNRSTKIVGVTLTDLQKRETLLFAGRSFRR